MYPASKLATAVLSVLGLPFLGMGIFAAYSFANARNQPLMARLGGAIFASVFAIIGGGLIFGSFYGYFLQKKQSNLELAHPNSPWLWRADWGAGRVESKNKASAIGLWVIALLVNMLCLPASFAGISKELETHDPTYIFPAALGLVGLTVLGFAIRASLRFERFGKTYFEMPSAPYCPGGRVSGSIHVQFSGDPAHGVDLKLACIRRLVTGTGEQHTTQMVPLWEADKNISAASLSRGPMDTVIPVSFEIPAEAYQTDHDNPNDQVLWTLTAKAEMPGVDYSDEFELPVFRIATSNAFASTTFEQGTGFAGGVEAGGFAQDGGFSQSAAANGRSEDVPEPAAHKVILKDSPDGLEVRFPAGRNIGRTMLVVVLATAITALFVYMWKMDRHTPFFAFAIVGLLDFFLILATVQAALSTTRIVVGTGVISWRHSVFGIGRRHELQISDVESILPVTSLQQAGSSGQTLYTVRLTTKSGRSHNLVNDIASRQEARWIIAKIQKRAGLKLNTQVGMANSLYGPPPQPDGPAGFGGQKGGATTYTVGGFRVSGKRTTNVSQAIGLLFFIAWLGFVLYMMLGVRGKHSASANNSATSHPHDAGGNSRPFVRSAAVKNASLDEVRKWLPQRQAEELMARGLEHDGEALDAIAESSPGWAGHIRITANLQQLEDQGRYTGDLRVRRAVADMDLMVDGWAKNKSSVDRLMQLVKTDAEARPRSLYLLGILAGDGVARERVQDFLIDTARKNTDGTSRRWATEGLSFVGTDAALDALFEIFTTDSAFNVRDRAGCNLAECGIFERKQRFRMVPRLIDLLADAKLNAQMKNWTLMALQEITDETIPADAELWRKWYAAKGAARRAEFEALEWWNVRGSRE